MARARHGELLAQAGEVHQPGIGENCAGVAADVNWSTNIGVHAKRNRGEARAPADGRGQSRQPETAVP
jgi:hypothetical protein